jgi:hypothetical protein
MLLLLAASLRTRSPGASAPLEDRCWLPSDPKGRAEAQEKLEEIERLATAAAVVNITVAWLRLHLDGGLALCRSLGEVVVSSG